MSTHFMDICQDHGTILAQCRCPDQNKTRRLKMCPGMQVCSQIPQALMPDGLDKLKEQPTPAERLAVLRQRSTWLAARRQAKINIGWDTIWDWREKDAIDWAIAELEGRR